MNQKPFPLLKGDLLALTQQYPTPFYLYDEGALLNLVEAAQGAFSFASLQKPSFFFFVATCPNPFILKILKTSGVSVVCSSMSELILAQKAGFSSEDVLFTQLIPVDGEILYANLMQANFALDDPSQLEIYEKTLGCLPETLNFAYNWDKKSLFGMNEQGLFQALSLAQQKGLSSYGLVVDFSSSDQILSYTELEAIFTLIARIYTDLGLVITSLHFNNRAKENFNTVQDLKNLANNIEKICEKILEPQIFGSLKISLSIDTLLLSSCFLVSQVKCIKYNEKKLLGVDAIHLCMPDSSEPTIFIAGKENREPTEDFFIFTQKNTQDKCLKTTLPPVEINDFLVVFKSLSGRSVESNAQGLLRSGELLLRTNNTIIEIRSKEQMDAYFTTLNFKALPSFQK